MPNEESGRTLELRSARTVCADRIVNFVCRSSKPSAFSMNSPNLRIRSGFSKPAASDGLFSATNSGSVRGSVAMKSGSMVKL